MSCWLTTNRRRLTVVRVRCGPKSNGNATFCSAHPQQLTSKHRPCPAGCGLCAMVRASWSSVASQASAALKGMRLGPVWQSGDGRSRSPVDAPARRRQAMRDDHQRLAATGFLPLASAVACWRRSVGHFCSVGSPPRPPPQATAEHWAGGLPL